MHEIGCAMGELVGSNMCKREVPAIVQMTCRGRPHQEASSGIECAAHDVMGVAHQHTQQGAVLSVP